MKNLLTVNEVADELALRPSTIRAWVMARRLPCVHVGRAVRIPAEAVKHYIERHTIPAREVRDGH